MKPITKTVTTVFKPLWVKHEFLVYNEGYRKARERMRTKMNRCFSCNRAFVDGEMMALASFGAKGNKVLCQSCAKEVGDE